MAAVPQKFEMQHQEQQLGYGEGWTIPNAPPYCERLEIPNEPKQRKRMSKPMIFIIVVIAIIIIVVLITALLVPLYLKIYSSNCLAGQCSQNPLSSCTSLSEESLSGYYWVKSSVGHSVQVYCDTSSPCGIDGAWMRVVQVDMSDERSQCPRSLCMDSSIKRSCILCKQEASSSSDIFTTKNVSYDKICGRTIAYQIGTTYAFYVTTSTTPRTIDEIYVDGVTITYGRPRHHVWTFAADHTENSSYVDGCHCNNYNRPSIVDPPSFVGTDYFCDTADINGLGYNLIFTGDPLWDGSGCGLDNQCCSFNNPPFFFKKLASRISEDIEMRVCRGRPRIEEDIALEIIEIYVQ